MERISNLYMSVLLCGAKIEKIVGVFQYIFQLLLPIKPIFV